MKTIVSMTKALADGNRLRVIAALKEHSELCVCQLTEMLGLATPTVSRHMSVLQQAGLVDSRKDGRWILYHLSESFPPLLLQWIGFALAESEQIARDREHLATIIACEPHELRKAQRGRRSSHHKSSSCAHGGHGRAPTKSVGHSSPTPEIAES
jgi:ArsR family transcriptional regulator